MGGRRNDTQMFSGVQPSEKTKRKKNNNNVPHCLLLVNCRMHWEFKNLEFIFVRRIWVDGKNPAKSLNQIAFTCAILSLFLSVCLCVCGGVFCEKARPAWVHLVIISISCLAYSWSWLRVLLWKLRLQPHSRRAAQQPRKAFRINASVFVVWASTGFFFMIKPQKLKDFRFKYRM